MYTDLTVDQALAARVANEPGRDLGCTSANLPALDTLLQRINWAFSRVREQQGNLRRPINPRIKGVIRRLSNGKTKSAHPYNLNAISDYCQVPYGWLSGADSTPHASEIVPGASQDALGTLWRLEYPANTTVVERLEWSHARARKMDPTIVPIQELDSNAVGAKWFAWSCDHDTANRLGRKLRVHAQWLLGADINLAKSKMPDSITAESMQNYLSFLARAGYPFYDAFIKYRSHTFSVRFNFAITMSAAVVN